MKFDIPIERFVMAAYSHHVNRVNLSRNKAAQFQGDCRKEERDLNISKIVFRGSYGKSMN